MKKKAPAKKKAAPRKSKRSKDPSLLALSIVEQVTGGPLKRR